jgi:hypothetical protein
VRREYSGWHYVRGAEPPEGRDYTCGWREVELEHGPRDLDPSNHGAVHIARVGAHEALCGKALGPKVQPEPVPKLGIQACRDCRLEWRKAKRT